MADACGVPSCDETETRLYAAGPRCAEHGWPEPAGRYCAPRRCYCGNCPSWTPVTPYTPSEHTILDDRAIASGRRRSSIQSYRNAQKAVSRT